jgi:hypothetical protein
MKKLFTLFLLLGIGLGLNAQVFINENFEGGSIPGGWTVLTAAPDGGWNVGSASDLASSFFPIPDNGGKMAGTNDDGCGSACNKLNDVLVMPAIDLSGVSDVVMVFDAFFIDETYQGVVENAYVVSSLDGGATWNNLFELSGSTSWQALTVDLASLAGNSAVTLGFRYSDNGGWLYGFAVDNILVYKPYDNDVKLVLNPVNRFNLTGSDIQFSGTITNNGLQNLTSLDIAWTDGTNTYTDNLTGLNVASGGTYNFTHSTPLEVSNAVAYNIEVTASNPNGQADGFPSNNSASALVNGLSFKPTVKMVAEEATGTWCVWCPRGFVFMSYMEETYEDFIGIAVHNGDPMENAVYDGGLTSFDGFTGFPSVVVDRRTVIDPSELEDYHGTIANRTVPVAATIVDALIDPATGDLTVNCEATFATQMDASQYRFNLVLVENGVTGTGSGYNQANAYAGGGAGPMGGWESLPNPVPASQMVYDEVARDILEGWAGVAGTVNVNADDVVSKSWTYDVPAAWDYAEMYAVFMVIDDATGEILNADERYLWTVSTQDFDNLERFTLSPNPANGAATLNLQLTKAADISIELVNAMGQTLNLQQLDNSFGGQFHFDLSKYAPGSYFVKVVAGDKVRVERLIIAR